jgi:hypothetical protein
MTVDQMHIQFKFGLDKLDALNYPNFLPEEIDLLLNQAQERFVKQRYGITNIKRTSFEESQKRTEDLKNLVVTSNITASAYDATNNISQYSRFFVLPNNHWFVIQESIKITDSCNNLVNAEVRPIQHNEYDKVVKDAFKGPDDTKVLRLMDNGKVEIIYNPNTSLGVYKLRYLKKPATINILSTPKVNCELSEHTHQEIVDESIKIALETIEAKRNQTFTPIIDNTKE